MNPALAAALIAGAALAPSGGIADLDALDARVARFTGMPAGQPGGALLPLDRRLRLRACAGEPALAWHGPGRPRGNAYSPRLYSAEVAIVVSPADTPRVLRPPWPAQDIGGFAMPPR